MAERDVYPKLLGLEPRCPDPEASSPSSTFSQDIFSMEIQRLDLGGRVISLTVVPCTEKRFEQELRAYPSSSGNMWQF